MFEKPLGLRENPFLAGHHPKYLFPSREHQEALAHLRYGIQNREPFVLITGEVGTGKTTAVYDALAEWGSRAVVALITNSALSRAELLEEICLRFAINLPAPVSKPQALVELQKQLTAIRQRGELAILLVDEAQNLDRELLEEIRLLSNLELGGEYLLQIFLVGQPELENKLAQKELRQLRQRIGIHYRILPLSANECARYIHHRVSVAGGNAEELFPAATCAEVFRVTNGIPREINVVAGQSLLNAFVDDAHTVTVEHVRAVEKEIEFQSVLKKSPEERGIVPRSSAGLATAAKPDAAPKPDAVPKPDAAAKHAAAPKHGAAPKSGAAPKHGAAPKSAPRPAAAAAPPPPPRPLAAPPPEPPAEDEIETYQQPAALGEDALVDDMPELTAAEVEPAAYEIAPEFAEADEEPVAEERPESTIRGTESLLPSWIDEIVKRRQAIDQRMAELAAQSASAAQAAQAPAPPPPIPLPTSEPYTTRDPYAGPYARATDRAEVERPEASGAMLAAPAPERVAPHPADPIPLFDDRNAKGADHLSPRLRGKLAEGDEAGNPRRSMLLPILGVVIAALAIAVVLFVRFGPFTFQRRAVPVSTPSQAPEDSTVRSSTPYPPFDRMNQPGSGLIARHLPRRPVPQTATEGGAPAEGGAGAVPPAGGGTSDAAAGAAGTIDATGAPTGGAAPSAGDAGHVTFTAATTFGIAVGEFMNEARANAERAKVGDATRLFSRVVTVNEDTVSMYRVVVGSYTDRTAAERAASDLVQRGLVNEARVVAVAAPAQRP